MTELLVFAITAWDNGKKGTYLVGEVLETLSRLLAIDWAEYVEDVGFKNIMVTIEKLEAMDHISRLTNCDNSEIANKAREIVDKYFSQDNDTDLCSNYDQQEEPELG